MYVCRRASCAEKISNEEGSKTPYAHYEFWYMKLFFFSFSTFNRSSNCSNCQCCGEKLPNDLLIANNPNVKDILIRSSWQVFLGTFFSFQTFQCDSMPNCKLSKSNILDKLHLKLDHLNKLNAQVQKCNNVLENSQSNW